MATDFTNNNTTIAPSGGFQPKTKNTPLDVRTRVNLKADIDSIPNPFVGMKIIVLQDETNDNQMTEYVVVSLKANSLGIADSKINEVVLAKDFLGVSSASGSGMTSEQVQQLNTAYIHSQTTHVQQSDIPTKTSQLTNDSGFITEHQDISNKADRSEIPTKTSQLQNDSDFATNASVDEKIASASTGGTVDLSSYAKKTDIPTKVSQLENDSNFISSIPEEYVTEQELAAKGLATETFVTNKISEASIGGGSGSGIKWLDVEDGEIFQTLISCMGITLSSSNLSFTENTTQTLTANVRPSDTSDEVVWSVNPTGIVSVNNDIVTPLINGDCIITATCGNYSATCNVNVSLPVVIECTGITLSSNALSFSTSDTQTLTATIQPSDCTQTPIWSVKPVGVVSIENNVVTPLVDGDCTISVTCGSQVASCTVNVSCFITTYTITNNLTNVISDNSAASISEGASYNATLTAENNYEISSVLVTMGGVDITSTAYSDGTISISNVTGNIEIIASAISTVQPTTAQAVTFVKNEDGTMYYEWDRAKMIELGARSSNGASLISDTQNSYNNDTYAMYAIQPKGYTSSGVIANRDLFKYIAQAKVIDISQSGALTDTTTILSDNEFYVSASSSASAVSVRIPKALGVDGKANDWLLNFINTDTIKLPVTTEPVTFEINPDNITKMSIKTNDDTCQYAQFNMSSYPSSNIYKGFNTLFGITGSNANLSNASAGVPACSTTILSIKFYAGTFTEFTLDNVKQYLTEHPLIFYYIQNN